MRNSTPFPLARAFCAVMALAPMSCGAREPAAPIQESVSSQRQASGTQDKQVASKPTKPRRVNRQDRAPNKLTIRFKRDRDMVVAKVMGQAITIVDIVAHIDQHTYKGFLQLAEAGLLDTTLNSPVLPRWARQFADIRALKIAAEKRKIPTREINEERRITATNAFLKYLETYKNNYRRDHGKEYPESVDSVKALNRRFLRDRGLGLEVEALLNVLVPDKLTQAQADAMLRNNPEIFNGYLDISVITINNRNPKSGALYRGEERAKVTAKIEDIQRRLEKDGSNFEEVASRMSEDKRRKRGGVFSNVARFQPNLPASICRVAFGLRNSQFKGPIESLWGLHFVKRIVYRSKSMVLRLDPQNKDVRRYVRQLRQENELFEARKNQKVELVY